MHLSAISVLVITQPSSEVPEGLMNYPLFDGVSVTTGYSASTDLGFIWLWLQMNHTLLRVR